MLGQDSRQKFGDNLPFLFKVLSVNKALSIQAHPDKKHAEELHKARPDIYKDSNHKPEMAIALTDFEGLCGFRPLSQIQGKGWIQNYLGLFLHILVLGHLKQVCQLREVIGENEASALIKATREDYQEPLRKAFTSLMNCSKDKLDQSLKALKDQIEKKTCLTSTERLFQRLWRDFPGDVGCFVIYFLNTIVLKPGENYRQILNVFYDNL